MNITHTESEQRGRYATTVDGGPEAEMTYRRQGSILRFDHTYVPPEYRGKGVAGELMRTAIAQARASGDQIQPLCSYVRGQFAKHPEWEDVLAKMS